MAVYCSSLISCFAATLLRYCLSDFEMVPVAPIITGFWNGSSRPYYYRIWKWFQSPLLYRILKWFQSSLLLPDFEKVPVAAIITGFWNGSSRPYYYRILKWLQSPLLLPASLMLLHSTDAEFLLWGLYTRILKSSQLLSRSHININYHACSLLIITHYDVRFVVRKSSVGSHLLVPWYSTLTFRTCFD